MPHNHTLTRAVAAALAIAAVIAAAAHARSGDRRATGVTTSSLAGTTSITDARSPDARDAAAGWRSLAPPWPRGTAALAQERYDSSSGDPHPISSPARARVADTGDGTAPLPFVLGVSGALLVGLATGIGLHQLHARRGHAANLAA